MKRTFVCFLILTALVSGIAISLSEETMIKYDIAGTEYSISLPADWLYGDKSVSDSSPIIKKMRTTADSFISDLSSDELLFVAIKDNKYLYPYLTFSVHDSSEKNYSEYSEKELDAIGKDLAKSVRDRYREDDVGNYGAHAKFVKLVLTDLRDVSQVCYYFTVRDGKRFDFLMYSSSSNSAENEKTIESIIRTFLFKPEGSSEWDTAKCSVGKDYYERNGFSQYIIENPFVSVFLPTDYQTIIRGDLPSNDFFNKYPDALVFSSDDRHTYLISMTDFGAADFNFPQTRILNDYIRAIYHTQCISNGDYNNQYFVRASSDACYIQHVYTNDGYKAPYFIYAFTVYNKKMVSICYQSEQPISNSEMEAFDLVMCSLRLDPNLYMAISLNKEIIKPEKAESSDYYYDDDRFWLCVPSSLIVYDRTTGDDNLLLCSEGLMSDQIVTYLDSNKIECYVHPYDNEFFITLQVISNKDDPDYTRENKLFVLGLGKTIENAYVSEGYSVKQSSTVDGKYYNSSKKGDDILIWLKYHLINVSDNSEIIIYSTTMAGRQYIIRAFSNLMSDDTIALVDSIIEASQIW